jgi:hypothetical protein
MNDIRTHLNKLTSPVPHTVFGPDVTENEYRRCLDPLRLRPEARDRGEEMIRGTPNPVV